MYSADLRIQDDGAEIEDLNADLLGGHVEGGGTVKTGQGSPVYALEAKFAGLKPAALGKLIGQEWTGGDFAASGKMELGGFAAKDLAASAKGTLHFDWRHGAAGLSGEICDAMMRRLPPWRGSTAGRRMRRLAGAP